MYSTKLLFVFLIGAVDPGRLNLVEDLNQGTNKTYLSILEEDFIVELIRVLVRAFLSFSDSGTADSCSFSIQEVLRAYGITGPGKSTSLSGRVWEKLPESMREVLLPLLSSHYSIGNETQDNYSLPIYKSSKDFSKWISTWSSHLMTKITDKPQILRVFNACKPVIKKDSGCAQFLLPYILVHVICHGSQSDREEIVAEVEAIIGNDDGTDHVATLNGSILSEQTTHAVSQDLGKPFSYGYHLAN